MIARYAFVRLDERHRGAAALEVAEVAQASLASLPQVRGVQVGVPADDHSAKGWDLSIALTFDTLEALEDVRAHPDYRAYADGYLAPRTHVIKAWNFDLG